MIKCENFKMCNQNKYKDIISPAIFLGYKRFRKYPLFTCKITNRTGEESCIYKVFLVKKYDWKSKQYSYIKLAHTATISPAEPLLTTF
jgi:hypothetical protein